MLVKVRALRKGVKGELPCEHAARAVFPSIRASLAKILIEEYNLNRYSVAKILGTTPAAITQYLEGKRGDKYIKKIHSNNKLLEILRKTAKDITSSYEATGKVDYILYQKAFCNICSKINELAVDRGCPATIFNKVN
ncbi:MAG: transcriptional regulator [Acidilobaceae archaeon]